jgi:histidinol-phosphatase (PHP family)
MEEMVLSAMERGAEIYCITEHYDYGHHIYSNKGEPGYEYGDMSREEVESLFVCDVEKYAEEFCRLREKYAGRIDLRMGMELGLQPGLADSFSEFSEKYPFDILIGSAHEAGGLDPYYPRFMEGRSVVDAYRFYYEGLLDCAKKCIGSYDTIAHPDYGLRYHHPEDFIFNYDDYGDILDELLLFLIAKGKALELNTGSLSYFRDDRQPITAIMNRYRQLGGELVTVGSDAHDPAAVMRRFDRAREILTGCGFKYYAVYKNRQAGMQRL